MPKMSSPLLSQRFQIEEYKALRTEIELYLKEARSQERYTIVAVGVIWGWLVIHNQTNWIVWTIPVLVTAASSLREIAIARHFQHLGDYLRKVEKTYGVTGWESTKKGWTVGVFNLIMNLTLFALSFIGLLFRYDLVCKTCHE